MISLKRLYEKLSPDVKAKVGDKVMGDEDELPSGIIAKLAKLQGLNPKQMDEPNTKWEKELASNLETWVRFSSNKVANYFKNNLDTFKKLAKEYPKIFTPPQGVPVYRGTKLNRVKTIEKLLKAAKKFEVATVGSARFLVLRGISYKPNRPSQSWTMDPNVAYRFIGLGDDSTPVVLVGKTDSSFIFSSELTAAFYGKNNEKEVIRVGMEGKFDVYIPIKQLGFNMVLHNLPSAKPYFQPVVDKYVEFVNTSNQAVSKVLEKQGKLSVANRNKLLAAMMRVKKVKKYYADPFNPKKDKFPVSTSNIKTIDQLINIPSRLFSVRYKPNTTSMPKMFDLELEYMKASNAFIKDLGK
jgi:hypothetical protein